MSGTSADGVDVAIVSVAGRAPRIQVRLITHAALAYPPDLTRQIQSFRTGSQSIPLKDLAALGQQITHCHAQAVRQALDRAGLTSSQLTAIAVHGQTLFHQPPLTIQWFDPALLAYELSAVVISDFRRADCAAGGQGAPLVPYADHLLFASTEESRVLLNIGGIANITLLPAGCTLDEVLAFDVGPGNCLSDHFCREKGDRLTYDAGGQLALTGQVIDAVVRAAMHDPYITQSPPKSTDTRAMIELFDRALAQCSLQTHQIPLRDLLATACRLSAEAILSVVPAEAHLIAAGGGTFNRAIMDHLKSHRRMSLTDDLGIPAMAREAMAFALLGAATLDGQPSNVPSCTGASRRVVLGSITPIP